MLHDSGLLERSKRGVWVYYTVHTGALADLAALIGGDGLGEVAPRVGQLTVQ